MKNRILLLATAGVLFGCGNSNDDFIDTPQKQVTYNSFDECKQDLSITQCQSALDNQQKPQDKINAGFANRDNTVANPQTVDKSTVECDKEKKDQSSEKYSDKCNTATSSRSSVYPAYGWGYAGNNSMGLQSSSQPANKSFSVTVPESTPTSHAATSRSIASSAKTSISRGGLGGSGRAFSSAAG